MDNWISPSNLTDSIGDLSVVQPYHDWVVFKFDVLFPGCVQPGHKVKIHKITPVTGNERGVIEIKDPPITVSRVIITTTVITWGSFMFVIYTDSIYRHELLVRV
jgi:hypothetical protein